MDVNESAAQLRAVLGGEAGPRADVVALNAGAALYAADAASSIAAGVEQARGILRTGRAARTLGALAEYTGR